MSWIWQYQAYAGTGYSERQAVREARCTGLCPSFRKGWSILLMLPGVKIGSGTCIAAITMIDCLTAIYESGEDSSKKMSLTRLSMV